MGIVVGHQPPIQNVGNMVVGIGQGQRAIRDQEFNTQTRQRDRQLDLQALSVYSQAQGRREGIAAQQAMQESAQDARLELADKEQSQYLEQLAAKEKLDRERTTWEYSELQKKEKEKLDEGRAWARQEFSAGRLKQEELDEFNQQFDAREYGILPVRKYNNDPTPDEIMAQRVWTDPTTKKRFYLEPNGRLKSLDDASGDVISFSDFAKVYQQNLKAESTDANGNEQSPDLHKVASQTFNMLEAFKAYQSGKIPDIDESATAPLDNTNLDGMDTLWSEGRGELKGGFMGWGHATKEEMAVFMQKFVTKAVSDYGVTQQQAENYFLKKWKSEASRRGFWSDDKVPNASKNMADFGADSTDPLGLGLLTDEELLKKITGGKTTP